MVKRFCPKCGRTDVDLYKGFCKDCYLETHQVAEFPEKVVVTRCPVCKSVYYKNKLIPWSRNVVEKIVRSKVRTGLFNKTFSFDWKDDKTVRVIIKGTLDEAGFFDVSVSGTVSINYEDRTCWVCSKRGTDYYEVEVQLRGDRQKIDQVLEGMLKYTEELARYHPEAELVYLKKVKEGVNVYYGYKPIALRVLNHLKSEEGLSYTASEAKMIRYNPKGRNVVHKTYCIRV